MKKNLFSFCVCICLISCLGAFLVHSEPAFAQESRGTIIGKVMDTSGAIIPGATVDITNKAMGTKTSIITNSEGFYQAPYLLPGQYEIVVEMTGFKKSQREVELRVNDRLEVDLKLEIGSPSEVVTVTDETPLLNTAEASMGQVVDSRRIAELPIGHGDPYALIGLSGGVTFTGSQRLDRPFEPTHIVGYAMDGTRGNRSDITIDGAASTATANAGEVISSFVPPQDLVQEFKVQTATFDASFGNTEGGVTNLSIKSGTNELHGTAYYSKFTKALTANDFFANATKQPLADFYYHRFGGTAGGPVYIPKLFNGKNRTFFMYGFEGIREARPRNNGTPTVPTLKMRDGDFSELLTIGSQYQIYNPFTRRKEGSRYRQDPFAGNIIPANLINPIAKKFVDNYLAKPITAGNADGTQNFQQPGLMETAKYYSHTIRLDHAFSDRHRVFGRASWYKRTSDYNDYFHNLSTGNLFWFISRQGVFDDVFTLNSTTVLNFRYGYNRFIRGTDGPAEAIGFDLTSLGFPSYYNSMIDPKIRRFPRFDISSYQGTGIGGEWRPIDTHSFLVTLNKAQGAHSLKAGVEFRAYRENDFFFGNDQTGRYTFDSTWTRGPLDNSTTSPSSLGQSFASFLLGVPGSGIINQPADYAEQSITWGIYFHDDWRVNHKLTLNLGLRYEFEQPMTERFDRSVTGFDFSAVQPMEAAAATAYAKNPTPEVAALQVRGGLQFANVNGQPRGLYNTPKKNIMPRFGFAYAINPKTLLRGGYGIFFGFLGQRRGDVVQSGYSTSTPMSVSLDSGLTFKETLSNPFTSGMSTAVGNAAGIQTFLGQSITFFNQNPSSPYMQRWQLSLQRELGMGFVVEAAYVGNRGTHVEMSRNLNATPNKYLSTSPTRDQAKINYLSTNLPNPFAGLMPSSASSTFRSANISRERLLRPYPQFDSVTSSNNDGYTWYHSAQLRLEKRFSKGYTLNTSYTFSKFMQATEYLNAGDPRPVEVISDVDRPHRLSVSGIYELPFGKGRCFGASVNPALSRIISGWQVGGIYTYQSGAPLAWGNIIFNGDISSIRLDSDQQTVARWFNTNAGFNKVSAEQLGSNVRTFPLRFGSIRADNTNNVDLSIIKNTQIKENTNFQFKAEFLNAFNHPLFPGPNVTVTAAAFGQVSASTTDNYARRIQLSLKLLF